MLQICLKKSLLFEMTKFSQTMVSPYSRVQLGLHDQLQSFMNELLNKFDVPEILADLSFNTMIKPF